MTDSRLLPAAAGDPKDFHPLLLLLVICRMRLLLLVVLASTAGESQLQVSLDTSSLAALNVTVRLHGGLQTLHTGLPKLRPIWLIQKIQLCTA